MPGGDMRRSAAWEKKRDRGMALVKALRESGQTVARFREAQGVSRSTLYRFCREFGAPVRPKAASLFIELTQSPAPQAMHPLEVVIGRGRCIRVFGEFDEAVLATLVRALEAR